MREYIKYLLLNHPRAAGRLMVLCILLVLIAVGALLGANIDAN